MMTREQYTLALVGMGCTVMIEQSPAGARVEVSRGPKRWEHLATRVELAQAKVDVVAHMLSQALSTFAGGIG